MLEPVRDDWGRGTPGEFQALVGQTQHDALRRQDRVGYGSV